MLHTLPNDVVYIICTLVDTRTLLHLSQVISIEDRAWTHHVRRRCGRHWLAGKRGVLRFLEAAYAPLLKPMPDHRGVAASSYASYMAGPGNLLGNMHGMCVTCLEVVSDDTIAVGHDYGVYLYGPGLMTPIWLGVRVNSVAYVDERSLWISTCQRNAFAFDIAADDLRPLLSKGHVFCVSGPIGIMGTSCGLWPYSSTRTVPCTHIVQSQVIIAGWHISGDVSVLSAHTKELLYMIDTGKRNFQGCRALSVIGDVVRVAGTAWSGGECSGRCPDDSRHASSDGLHVYSSANRQLGLSSA